MSAFYNEIDPYAAQWLRNLIAAGHIAPGVVDERPIQEIEAWELTEFTQCHFFAGIGVWSHALRRAGWPDDQPIWTGSCPCQPFSTAGKQKGFQDDRHLWPYWFNLIEQCKPPIVIGEQVASALGWFDLVSADMEGAGYAIGAADLCAAGFGPEGFGGAHIRQRLYFAGVAHTDRAGWRQAGRDIAGDFPADEARARNRAGDASENGGVADAMRDRTKYQPGAGMESQAAANGENGGLPRQRLRIGFEGPSGGLADADQQGSGGRGICGPDEGAGEGAEATFERSTRLCQARFADASDGIGESADWLYCRDGKWRPVEPGTFPLADAAPARVGRLRAYGNALDAETATAFAEVVKEIFDGV